MSSTGSGASQRRSSTRAVMPWRREPPGHPQAHRHAVAEGDDGQVGGPRRDVRAAADRRVRHRASTVEPAVVAGRRAGRGCGRGRSAPGTPRPCRRWRPRRRRCAASPPRRRRGAGQATTRPGMSRSTATRVVVVEVAAEALLVGQSRRPAPPSGCGTCRGRRTTASPPRRAAGPRRCAGRRGTGSPGRAAVRPARAERQAEDRLLVEQGVEDPGRRRTGGPGRG